MKIKLIFTFLLIFFNSILFSYNNSFTSYDTPKVEVGIESIIKLDENHYVISLYSINPFDSIAGIQFQLLPSGLFTIESVFGGRVEEKEFDIHFNKTGTILGFSMVGNSIDPSRTISGPNKKIDNILCYINVIADSLDKISILDMKYVLASKNGESLSTSFIPFDLFEITK